ncbi:MAG TPA: nitrate reductase [Rubrobacteraceae bacterium]|nr:nitrate reductase [Rubrobacteraceae bacterium]
MAQTKTAKQPGRWIKSTCPYCGVGCGVEVGVENEKIAQIRGDKSHPANFGKLCPKPTGLPEAVSSPDRLTHPLRKTRSGGMQRISWDDALAEIAGKLQATIERHGPEAAAFYISGQLLTEDYYAANKLAKGFLGVNNVDSNSRLCMSSAVAGYTGAFGTDGPPSAYADIAFAECVLLWGSNTADCHPITFGRIKQRKKDPAVSVIVVDPRRTGTAEIADLHLRIKPGTDLALANAMLRVLIYEGFMDQEFVGRRTSGFEAAAQTAREWTPGRAARVCGVEVGDIVWAARKFGDAKASLSLWTMGVNQSTVGTKKNRAIINLHLATGNIGKPGAGPFSLTGQPNAMGGREVGGLAHLLPGYRLIENEQHRREAEEAWGLEPGSISERPGLPATEMFRALEDGAATFLWVAATNPAASMPDLARTRRALENTEFVVVQDAYPTETTARADLVLPAAQWGEKTGTMTNSERRVSIVEKVVEPPGEARPDWEIFAGVARLLGFEKDFAWQSSADVYDEYKEMTRGTVVDVTGLSFARLRRGPVQWPVPETLPYLERPSRPMMERTRDINGEHPGTPRLYADKKFNTPDRRARFEPTPHQELHEPPGEEYPLTLSNGRVKNQWHTMTRTGRSEKLLRDLDGPFVEVHPEAAGEAGVETGEEARVSSARGSFVARVVVTEDVEPTTIFAPFHWGDLWTDGGSLNNATHDAADPISHQPELKGAAVRLEPANRIERADHAIEKETRT